MSDPIIINVGTPQQQQPTVIQAQPSAPNIEVEVRGAGQGGDVGDLDEELDELKEDLGNFTIDLALHYQLSKQL